jgi:hypothetical protein
VDIFLTSGETVSFSEGVILREHSYVSKYVPQRSFVIKGPRMETYRLILYLHVLRFMATLVLVAWIDLRLS